MTREEKCKILIEKGYTYDAASGDICNKFGKILSENDVKRYIQIKTDFNKKNVRLLGHHFAWYSVYGNCDTEQIDHINGNRHDNRICNLRNVTGQQNQWNRVTAKGYTWHKLANKWSAMIKLNNKSIYLGLYNTEQEARTAYLNAKEKYHII